MKTTPLKIITILGILFVGFIVFAKVAHAATFTVNTTDDGSDVNPGNGICEITLGEGNCGIRALIEETNALGGTNTGNFNISGPGVQTFVPASGYPSITNSLTIDATTQPGTNCGTLVPSSLPSANTPHTLIVQISADNIVSGNQEAFIFSGPSASNSALKGVIINGLQQASGVVLRGNDPGNTISGVTVECNYIGTNQAGTSALAGTNPSIGVYAFYSNLITVQNNLISGGWSAGVLVNGQTTIRDNLIGTNAMGTGALGNTVGAAPTNDISNTAASFNHNIVGGNNQKGISPNGLINITNNYVGLGVTGQPLANTGDGIYLQGSVSGMVIGGASSGNVISANTGNGIHVIRTLDCIQATINTTIIGNYIGTNTSGTVANGYGNQLSGIAANETENSCGGSVYRHRIGGDGTGEANTIAGNSLDGVRVYEVNSQDLNTDVFSIAVLTNSIFSNGNLGINLAADSNNSGSADVDLGPNAINSFLMNYPASHANYYINHPTVNSSNFSGNQVSLNYDFQAPSVSDNDTTRIAQGDVVGFRLDFYLNPSAQDGAYGGYNQGKTHLGSFIVNGSETGATHTFTSPIATPAGMSVNATATVLWQILSEPPACEEGIRFGNGPPYQISSGCN